MNRLRICFKVLDLGVDENGFPCPAGMCIDLGETEREIDYAELTKGVNKRELMAYLGLKSIDADKMVLITPEEYDRDYGDSEDEA